MTWVNLVPYAGAMRQLAVVTLASCLPGCLMAAAALHEPEHGRVHAPNAADYAAWVGAPKPQLETHRKFALLPRQVRQVSDGSEMWVLRHCATKTTPLEECCLFEFVIASNAVASYRSVGECKVDCSTWPEPKVQGCINDAVVPDGYGRSK